MDCQLCGVKLRHDIQYFHICECSNLCYVCFIDLYVIYNQPPSKIQDKCGICSAHLSTANKILLFKFVIDYHSSEYPYF